MSEIQSESYKRILSLYIETSHGVKSTAGYEDKSSVSKSYLGVNSNRTIHFYIVIRTMVMTRAPGVTRSGGSQI